MNKYKMLCAGAAMIAVLGAATLPAYASDEVKIVKASPIAAIKTINAGEIDATELKVEIIDIPTSESNEALELVYATTLEKSMDCDTAPMLDVIPLAEIVE